MKICPHCEARFDTPEWTCPVCGKQPHGDRFLMFAPELDASDEGFELTSFAHLAQLEATSFWFRARNRLVAQLLRRHFPSARKLLEIGSGTGYVLAGLRRALPQLELVGAELHTAGLRFASERLPGVELYQMDGRHIPFESEFDVVSALDVIEHVDEDSRVLAEMHRATRPGGGLIVSVPQHPWLWSAADDFSHHVRRYRRRELAGRVESAGFEVVQMTSFVTTLLPVLAVSRRRLPSLDEFDPGGEYRLPRVIDRLLEGCLDAERFLIGRGFSLPAGGSLFVVGRKPS